MTRASTIAISSAIALFLLAPEVSSAGIPLPEHPRPDLERPDWVNLNGVWSFRFDPGDAGEKEGWGA
ncbi:MAG: hypothetical protein JXA90_03845, partial [Planctomycetes bacterium]|nr:hypothetical protein [Planctomycetota bacterium]